MYYVEPPASCTVNEPLLVVTAINADKYSELAVATFTHNTNTYDVNDRISTTGFYRNTWMLELGLNVLHLYSMDTEGNAAERTIEVIYDPEYEPEGEAPDPENPPETNCVRMAIANLTDSLSVRGDAVTLWAEALAGDLDAVDAVSFEARGAGTGGAWHVIDTSLAAPHVASWNADAWPEGAYQLRAVAISLDGCVDSHAAMVEVTADGSAAYHERVASGVHTLTAPVSAATDTVLVLWDGNRFARILLPAGALGADDTLTAFFPDAADFTPTLTSWQIDAALFLDVSLASHTGNFLNDKHATLEVGYPDANGDGLLDGSGLPVSQLALRYLPAPDAAFSVLPASRVSWSRQCVIGETRHFSVFGVVSEQSAPPLNLLTQSLPDGTEEAAYSVALEADGGIPPYSWSIVEGTLPPGLSLNVDTLEGIPTMSGAYSFTLQVSDAQAIPYMASIPLGITIFAPTQPTVTVTRADGQSGLTNTLPVRWNITFSEAVTGFTASDIVFRGSGAFGLDYTLTGGGAAYVLEITGMPYDGTLRPTIPANVAGNNQPSVGEEQVWVDRKAPLAVFGRLYPGGSVTTTNTLPIAFSLTFDETVTGLDSTGIGFSPVVPGLAYAVQGSGRHYTLLVTDASGASDIMPVLLAGAAQDAAGNNNPEIAYDGPTVQYTPDTRPTVTLNQAPGQQDPTKDFPIVFEIAFSETVSGFTVDHVIYLDLPDKAPNPVCTLTGSGANYTLTVTGADGDGRLGFQIPATDDWRASTSMDNVVTLDTTPPTVSIGAPSIGQTLRGPVSFPVQYTGATNVTLSASDVALHGTPTAQVTVTGTGTAARVVTLSGIDGAGTLAISLEADTATDGAGNLAPATGPSDSVEVSPFTVTVERAAEQAAITNALPIIFDVLFSREVLDFNASHVTMDGAAGGVVFNVSGSGMAHTLTVTAVSTDGSVMPGIPAGILLDTENEINEASTGVDGVVVYDTQRPGVTVGRADGQSALTNSTPIVFDVVFTEPVFGFDETSVTIGGTASGVDFELTGEDDAYTITITAIAEDGTVIVAVPENRCQDAAGNWNTASTGEANTVTYDSTPPALIVSRAATQNDPTNGLPIVFDVLFTEPVFTFDETSVTIGGTASGVDFELTGEDDAYTITITAIAEDGTVIVTVPENRCQDAAGNWNTSSTGTNNMVTYDVTPPTVIVRRTDMQPLQTNSLPIVFDVEFNEEVTGFDASDVTMGGTAEGVVFSVSGSGTAYTITVTNLDTDGTVIPTIQADVCTDLADNPNEASTGADNIVTYDTVPPIVTVNQATEQADPTNALPILFDVVFDEPVLGFDISSVEMVGTATGVSFTISGDGPDYIIQVSAIAGDGTVVPTIPAGVCTDLAGNPNEASTSTDNSVTYDTQRPGVTVSRADGQPALTNSTPIVFDVAFTKPVFGFDESSVDISGTATGVDFTVDGEDGAYTVTVTAIAEDGTVAVTVPANRCQDAAGNGNTVSTGVNNMVTYDITPPEFLDIEATPSPAGGDAVVELTFRASEALSGDPTVTVHGNPADYISRDGLQYVYTYTVLSGDPPGAATIVISGTDLAGNPGETEDTSALEIDHTKPTANFGATPRAGMPPLEVTFTDLSTPVSGTPITDWAWDFGDGTPPVSGQNPAPHNYSVAGVYTVTLTITDSATNSDSETKTGYIVVGGPASGFDAEPTTGHAPMTVQFTDTSDAGASPITAWHWTFGDGATSDQTNPTHSYTSAGMYNVSLTVTTAVTSDTYTAYGHITVQAGIPPTAGFSASPTTGYAPLSVQFMDASDAGSHSITAWAWDFGDGATSDESAPTHVYETPGVYDATLTVTTAAGADTLTRVGYVHVLEAVPPTANFTATPTAGAAPLTVQFEDTSAPGSSSIEHWHWDFGDGMTSAEQHPEHVYHQPGVYDVSLTVTTLVGSDTRTAPAYIRVVASLSASGLLAVFLLAALLCLFGAKRGGHRPADGRDAGI